MKTDQIQGKEEQPNVGKANPCAPPLPGGLLALSSAL